jgi:neutral amino acid transport system ATP-binding protein
LSNDPRVADKPEARPILEATGLSKSFDGLVAVDEASFVVQPQSITALIGPNGAGKTTVFNLISGFLKADSGQVRFEDQLITGRPAHEIARVGVARTFQIPRALTRLSVLENVMLASPLQIGERISQVFLSPRAVRREQRSIKSKAMEVLRLVRLDALAMDYAGTLSGGQRKLLELARALMTRPRLVLLDEPMAGVNPTLGAQLLEYVELLREESGITFILIEHDMDVVMTVSDTVIVMDEGKVVVEAPPDEVRANPRVIEAYLGRHVGDDE